MQPSGPNLADLDQAITDVEALGRKLRELRETIAALLDPFAYVARLKASVLQEAARPSVPVVASEPAKRRERSSSSGLTAEVVLEAIAKYGPASRGVIGRAVGTQGSALDRVLSTLRSEGRVAMAGTRSSARYSVKK